MKRILLLLLISCCFAYKCYAQNINIDKKIDSIASVVLKNNTDIECLTKKVAVIDNSYEKHTDLISKSNESMSNALSINSIIVGIISVIVTVFGIGLGVYISRKEKSVTELLTQVNNKKNEVDQLKQDIVKKADEVLQLKNEVTELNTQIHSDMSGLYQKLKREETQWILKRLVAVPMDIGNVIESLLSRDLDAEDYAALLIAYANLLKSGYENKAYKILGHTNKDTYIQLFVQHFLGVSLNNVLIKNECIEFFRLYSGCAFPNDIIKSTTDMLDGIKEWNNTDKKSVIATYIKAMYSSQHENLDDMYKIIVSKLSSKEISVELWDSLVVEGILLNSFAKVIRETYNDDTELTAKINEDIEKIIPKEDSQEVIEDAKS